MASSMAGVGVGGGKTERALDSVRERPPGKYGVGLVASCYTVYHRGVACASCQCGGGWLNRDIMGAFGRYADYRTGERIPKDSARWYAKVIETNGECL